MKNLIIVIFCALIFNGCLNTDNLAPYQTGLSTQEDKSKTIREEKVKIEEITKKLKAQNAQQTEPVYTDLNGAFNSWIDAFVVACKEDNIKNDEYQNALAAYEEKYTQFIAFASDNMSKTDFQKIDISENTYRYEVYAKRLFNKYRNDDENTKNLIIEKIYEYKLVPFDKL